MDSRLCCSRVRLRRRLAARSGAVIRQDVEVWSAEIVASNELSAALPFAAGPAHPPPLPQRADVAGAVQ